MSVDFYVCEAHNGSVYEEYIGFCTECNHRFCTHCVVNDNVESDYAFNYGVRYDGSEQQREEYGIKQDEYEPEIGGIIDGTSIAPEYCPFCSGGRVTDEDLLKFAFWYFKTTKDDLVKVMKKNPHWKD